MTNDMKSGCTLSDTLLTILHLGEGHLQPKLRQMVELAKTNEEDRAVFYTDFLPHITSMRERIEENLELIKNTFDVVDLMRLTRAITNISEMVSEVEMGSSNREGDFE